MQLSRTYRYEGTIDAVRSIVTDEELYADVAERSRALSHSVDITTAADGGTTVVLRRDLPTDQIPSFAQGFVGSTLTVVETTVWPVPVEDGPVSFSEGDFEVAIDGTPVTFRGTIRLDGLGGQVTQLVNGELKAKVPFVGKKIEASVEPIIGHQLDVLAELVGTRLSRL